MPNFSVDADILADNIAPPIAALNKAVKNYPISVFCEGKIKYNQSPYLDNCRQLKNTVPSYKVG